MIYYVSYSTVNLPIFNETKFVELFETNLIYINISKFYLENNAASLIGRNYFTFDPFYKFVE